MADRLPAQEKTGLESRPEMSLAFFDSELFAALKPYLSRQIKPGIGEFYALNLEGIKKAAAHWRVTSREAMIFCLQNDVWPLRFSRNRGILQAFEQAKLLETEVAIIGCGGLGGHLLALLARLGIGAFNLCDGDFLEESNLNRQLLCREDNLGQNKAEAAAQFLSQVASHALARVFPQKASETSLPEIIGSSRLVLDGLDNVAGRLILERQAHFLNIPYIYGAMAGEEGFAYVSRPGSLGLSAIYGNQPVQTTAEDRLGTPTLTPALTAGLQSVLAMREMLGLNSAEAKLCRLDLSVPELELFHL